MMAGVIRERLTALARAVALKLTRPHKHGLDALEPRAAAPGSPERALVAPLEPGASLAGFDVRSISVVEAGVLTLECARGPRSIRLYVALEGGPVPAAVTCGRYAVFYSTGEASGFRDPDGERLAKALAAVLERHRELPPPDGLRRFSAEAYGPAKKK
jgi:hypothetical protein